MIKTIRIAVGYAAHGAEWLAQGSGATFSVARAGKLDRTIEVHVMFEQGLPPQAPKGIDFTLTGPRGTIPVRKLLTERDAGCLYEQHQRIRADRWFRGEGNQPH